MNMTETLNLLPPRLVEAGTPTHAIRLTNGDAAIVAIIFPGQPYGRSATNDGKRVLVEFRLTWACFQYHATTILKPGYNGLCLDMGQTEATTISAEVMQDVKQWIMETL